LLLIIFVSFNCTKKVPPANYAARVNDSYLTSEEFASLLDTSNGSKQYKSEIIHNWVNSEVLYLEAKKEGILKKAEFNRIMDESKINLAGSLLIQKYLENAKLHIDSSDVFHYYIENRDQFKVFGNSYIINRVDFSNEDRAVRFRSTVLEVGWNPALKIYLNDSSLTNYQVNKLINEPDVHPVSLLRVLNELYPKEVSIVIPNDTGGYIVVQLLNTLQMGTIPPFNVIRNEVQNRYLAKKRVDLLKSFMQHLYEEYDIEIKN
jgi:hypothetical protein